MSLAIWIPEVLAALAAVGGWMVASHRDDAGQPRKHRVRAGTVLAALGLLLGLLLVPSGLSLRAFALAVLVVIVTGGLLLRGAAKSAQKFTSTAEVVTTAVGLTIRRDWQHRVALAVTIPAGLVVGAWFEHRGQSEAALLAAMIVLAPTRLMLGPARRMERTRTAVEGAMAGVLAGGHAWDGGTADAGGAPVTVRFDAGQFPTTVTCPLPASWTAKQSEGLGDEIEERLAKWGRPWVVHPDHSERHLVAQIGGELPEMIAFDAQGMPGDPSCRLRSHTVRIGMARVSKAAAKAGRGAEGSLIPFDVDFSKTPHGIIVGQTGGGKSVEDRIIVTQWAARIGEVVLCDPKRVEFMMFEGRKGIRLVATSLPEIMEALAAVEAEMMERYDFLVSKRVTSVSKLESDRPVPVLCAVDEAYELLSKSKASDEDTKAENEMRARCSRSIQAVAALGRAVDVHMILLAQRADRAVIEGVIQNNTPFRSLAQPAQAGHTERNMCDLNAVAVHKDCPGRAVAQAIGTPECEVQVTFLDEDDLDRWLPMQPEGPSEPSGGPGQPDEPTGPLDEPDEPTGPSDGRPEPVGVDLGKSPGDQQTAAQQGARRDKVFGLTQTPAAQPDGTSGLDDDVWALFSAEPVVPEEAEVGPDGAGSGKPTVELVEPDKAELPERDEAAPVEPGQAGSGKPTVELAKPGPAELDESAWRFLDDDDEDPDPG